MPSTRARVGSLHFAVCLGILLVAYSAYVLAQTYKLYYFGWALCLVTGGGLLVGRRLRLHAASGAWLPLLAFYGYLVATLAWSPDPHRTAYYLAADVLTLVAFFLGLLWAQNTSREQLGRFLEMMVLAHLFLVAVALVRIGSIVDDSYLAIRSAYGFTFATAIPFLVWRAGIHRRLLSWVLLVVSVGILAILGSRTGLIALPVLLTGALIVLWRTSRSRALVWLAGASAAASVLLFLGLQSAAARESFASALTRFGGEGLSLDVTSNVEAEYENELAVDIDRRLQAFVAIESFIESPWIGRGYMSTAARTEDLYGRPILAHGLPFTLLGETGLAGTALFLWVLVCYFRRLRWLSRRAPSARDRGCYATMMLTMVGMLIFGVSHQVHQTPAFFVLLAWPYGTRPDGAGMVAGPPRRPSAVPSAPPGALTLPARS